MTKVILDERLKMRIELLRTINKLRKEDLYKILGFTKQNYYNTYKKSLTIQKKRIQNVADFFEIDYEVLVNGSYAEWHEIKIIKDYEEIRKLEKVILGLRWGTEHKFKGKLSKGWTAK